MKFETFTLSKTKSGFCCNHYMLLCFVVKVRYMTMCKYSHTVLVFVCDIKKKRNKSKLLSCQNVIKYLKVFLKDTKC